MEFSKQMQALKFTHIYIYVHEFMGLGLFICLANVHVFQSEGMIEDRCIYMHIDIIFIIYIYVSLYYVCICIFYLDRDLDRFGWI